MRRRIQPDTYQASVTLRDPEPIGAGAALSLAAVTGLGMSGRSGTVRTGWGSRGFAGHAQPMQLFAGGGQIGANPTRTRTARIGLPNTTPPSGERSVLETMLAAYELSGGR